MDSSQNGPGGVNGSNGMSRAERFEDEKRRIVDSCFIKTDNEGSLLESYITHIRIIEDAAYPSSPPPPNADPKAKKPRLIIVAVRKTGRVRMHKARENANGTFSIGKTWMLDDLSAIQSFSNPTTGSAEDEQQKQWAGGNGFIVTIGKPYYWQANTPKEKQFFIASLVKIYIKYTGGKTPELTGFEAREREQLVGASGASGAARPAPQQPLAQGPPYQSQNRTPRRDPSAEPPAQRKPPSREAMQRPPGQIPPSSTSSFTSQTSRPGMRTRREESPSSIDSNTPLAPQNQRDLRRLAGGNESQESFSRSDDGMSGPPRSRGGLNGLPNAPGRFQDRSMTPTSLRAGTPDSGFSSARDTPNDIPPVPAPLRVGEPLAPPPERRRPPMPILGDSRQRGQNPVENIVPAPLASPGMRRDELRPPLRSSERTQPRERDPESNGSSNVQLSNDFSREDLSQTQKASEESAKSEAVRAAPVPVAEPAQPSPITSPIEMPPEPEEEVRPGLGPMIKNKQSKGDIASTFLRAAKTANAFNSFKPRAGGAAERLRETQAKTADGPDGITSVVPAPSLIRGLSNESSNITPTTTIPDKIDEKSQQQSPNDGIPSVKITVPGSDRPTSVEGPLKVPQQNAIPEKPKIREVKRPKPASETMQRELATLGVDPSILGGRGNDLVSAWDEFGWVGEGVHTKNIDQMREEIERELNKVQAGGWLSRFDEEDERVEAIQKGLDKVMDECDEMDGLLTLYLVELGTLNEDVAYIEAQSQGLQVQTANQKLLQTELQALLDTISISSEDLGSLREASLESPRGLEQIEKSLVMLFKAMITIDPSLSLSGPRASEDGGSVRSGKRGAFGNSEIGSMRVLQEKKDVYRNESVAFLRRLKPFLQVKFGASIDETRKALEREKGSNLTRVAGKAKLDPRNHDLSRNILWRYSPLMLFSREVDRLEWEDLMKTYEMVTRPLYQDEFRDAVFSWKRIARKLTGDETDILFSSQVEKQTEGIATTARKLTVKRSQTLAKSLRSPIGDSSSKTTIDKSDGRLQPYEVFGGALDEMIPIMSMEQNFIVEFFHVTSLEQYDFSEAVAAAPPDMRQGGDLRRPRVMDPNRDLGKKVSLSMEEVYSFFSGDMQAFVDWSLQADPLQGVGVIAAIERKLVDFEGSSQEFLARTLQQLHRRLVGLFTKFLDEQIRAIEDTKVKIKKRKGVIGFVRIFPSFSLALETMLTTSHDLEVRQTVNQAYTRIIKAMFESLKVIARENPGAQTAGADPEDKEALNYQVLLIENMNHYLEEVDTRSNPVLEDWKQSAAQEMEEHMSLYLGAVIRRPLGKLLDFLESIESLMLSRQSGDPASKISSMPSHSESTFKKILAGYDSKEIRKGIETLKRRVEKHFGDADDPGLSRGLVLKVQQNCEKYYERVEDRILTISRDVYNGNVVAEWTKADVSTAFRNQGR